MVFMPQIYELFHYLANNLPLLFYVLAKIVLFFYKKRQLLSVDADADVGDAGHYFAFHGMAHLDV